MLEERKFSVMGVDHYLGYTLCLYVWGSNRHFSRHIIFKTRSVKYDENTGIHTETSVSILEYCNMK